MTIKNIFTKTILASTLVAMSNVASAAAFQLAEVSTSGLGRAYSAEAAIGDDASVIATNPALMTKFDRSMFSAGGIYIMPNLDVEGKINGTYKDKQTKVAPNQLVPSMYFVAPINDKFAVGGGVNVNYGLATEYDNDFNMGFFGGKTNLVATNFNVSGAYRYNNHLSFGLGANVVYAKATVERRVGKMPGALVIAAVDNKQALMAKAQGYLAKNPELANKLQSNKELQGKLNKLKTLPDEQLKHTLVEKAEGIAKANNINSDTVLAKLTGSKVGFGVNAGILYEFDKNNRIGLAYHSPVKIKFKGKFSNGLPSSLTIPGVSNPEVAGLINGIYGKLNPTNGSEIDGSLDLTLPAYAELSGYHKVTQQFAMHYSVKWTQWSSFDKLHAFGNDGTTLFEKQEGFRDSMRLALGATYDVNEALTLRTGIAYDESAIGKYQTISIPDTDRTWYSVGATYRFNKDLSMDLAYAYVQGKKTQFIEKEGPLVGSFKTKASVNLIGLNVNYSF